MSRIPQSLLTAGAEMFSAYVPDLTPGKLEQVLKDASKPVEIKPGYTISQFAKLAGVTRQTVYNWEINDVT